MICISSFKNWWQASHPSALWKYFWYTSQSEWFILFVKSAILHIIVQYILYMTMDVFVPLTWPCNVTRYQCVKLLAKDNILSFVHCAVNILGDNFLDLLMLLNVYLRMLVDEPGMIPCKYHIHRYVFISHDFQLILNLKTC
jgi:hypothetical protein